MPEPVVGFSDVTAILRLLADMRDDLRSIREFLLEEDDGEEEEDPETDA